LLCCAFFHADYDSLWLYSSNPTSSLITSWKILLKFKPE